MQENSTLTTNENEKEKAPATRVRAGRYLPRLWWGLGLGAVLAGAFLATVFSTSGFSLPRSRCICRTIPMRFSAFGQGRRAT